MDNPKLSIITINLNNSVGLRRTIESVINQAFDNYEYIVIDGGSSDGSVEVIKEFADRITYWVSEPDKGIYNAMNKGILKAKGEYLQFLNSGDWLVDYEVLDKIFIESSESDLIYGNLVKIFSDGRKVIDKGPESPVLTFQTFYSGTINHAAAYIRRELFNKFGLYDEQLKISADWKFFLIAFGLNKTVVSYKNIEIACFDMAGISNTNKDLRNLERQKVLYDLVPYPILEDYQKNSSDYYNLKKIRKHPITDNLFQFCLKVILKLSGLMVKHK